MSETCRLRRGEGYGACEDDGWSDSVSNLSNKLQRESLRYREAVQLADVLGYELIWQKKREAR